MERAPLRIAVMSFDVPRRRRQRLEELGRTDTAQYCCTKYIIRDDYGARMLRALGVFNKQFARRNAVSI